MTNEDNTQEENPFNKLYASRVGLFAGVVGGVLSSAIALGDGVANGCQYARICTYGLVDTSIFGLAAGVATGLAVGGLVKLLQDNPNREE